MTALEHPGRVDRMRDRRAEPAAALEHAGGLGHGPRHLVHVVQAHIGHNQVERGIAEGQRGRVGDYGRLMGSGSPAARPHHRRRGVGPGHPMAERPQEPAEPRPSPQPRSSVRFPGCRQQVAQRRQVDVVVRAVVARRAGELRPFPGLGLPAVPHPHPGSLSHRDSRSLRRRAQHHSLGAWPPVIICLRSRPSARRATPG